MIISLDQIRAGDLAPSSYVSRSMMNQYSPGSLSLDLSSTPSLASPHEDTTKIEGSAMDGEQYVESKRQTGDGGLNRESGITNKGLTKKIFLRPFLVAPGRVR